MERGKVNGTADYIVPLGIVGLGALIAWKFGLFTTPAPTGGGAGNKATTTTTTTAAATNDVAAAQAANVVQSLSNSQIAGIASQLTNLFNANPIDQEAVVNAVIQVNTSLDWALLEQAFGTKDYSNSDDWFGLCSSFGLDCHTVNLDSALMSSITDATQKMNLNGYFAGVNINFSI